MGWPRYEASTPYIVVRPSGNVKSGERCYTRLVQGIIKQPHADIKLNPHVNLKYYILTVLHTPTIA